MAIDEARVNLITQNLAAQRNQLADEAVMLRVELGLRDQQIKTLTEQVEVLRIQLLKLVPTPEIYDDVRPAA